MRKTTNKFLIDGRQMYAPDENMEISVTDIVDEDSGRDESGFLHRFVLRQNVGKWTFTYSNLSKSEYIEIESLFVGKDTFQFTYRDFVYGGLQKTITAYRGEHKILWKSEANEQFCNYRFTIYAC